MPRAGWMFRFWTSRRRSVPRRTCSSTTFTPPQPAANASPARSRRFSTPCWLPAPRLDTGAGPHPPIARRRDGDRRRLGLDRGSDGMRDDVDDALPGRADQARGARVDALRTLGRLAHDEHRLREPGGLLLDATRVGDDQI